MPPLRPGQPGLVHKQAKRRLNPPDLVQIVVPAYFPPVGHKLVEILIPARLERNHPWLKLRWWQAPKRSLIR